MLSAETWEYEFTFGYEERGMNEDPAEYTAELGTSEKLDLKVEEKFEDFINCFTTLAETKDKPAIPEDFFGQLRMCRNQLSVVKEDLQSLRNQIALVRAADDEQEKMKESTKLLEIFEESCDHWSQQLELFEAMYDELKSSGRQDEYFQGIQPGLMSWFSEMFKKPLTLDDAKRAFEMLKQVLKGLEKYFSDMEKALISKIPGGAKLYAENLQSGTDECVHLFLTDAWYRVLMLPKEYKQSHAAEIAEFKRSLTAVSDDAFSKLRLFKEKYSQYARDKWQRMREEMYNEFVNPKKKRTD